MKHYFLDTNVVLDFLARREPFAEAALDVFRAGLERQATLYVASLSFSTIYYVMRRQTSRPAALAMVAQVAQLVTIVAVAMRRGCSKLLVVRLPTLRTVFSTTPLLPLWRSKPLLRAILPILSIACCPC